MLKPDWKYIETTQKKIRVIKVNLRERDIDVTDLENGMIFCIDVNEKIDLEQIKRAKIYKATVKKFEADFTPEFEKQWIETAKGDAEVLKGLEVMKANGAKPTKYELISLTH